ncbi:hypothetical protein, partial [Okeania hirsuta]|uniref:hypothetical protein n=1 Tax=Okeania hirsuta TaxID=1458930 RepID=UPI001960C7F8
MLKKRCDPATTIVARERAPRDHKLASAIADCGFYEFKRQLIEPLSVSLDAVCAFGFRPLAGRKILSSPHLPISPSPSLFLNRSV